MKTATALFASSLLFSVAGAANVHAELRPVEGKELNQYIGWTVVGAARAPLGVISKVDLNAGVIGVVGRHGEFALMHTSALRRNGLELAAPTVSIGDFARASIINMARPGSTIIFPSVIVNEPPLG
jgi:hypothetical protein